MLEPVPDRVERRVSEAEVATQVDDERDALRQRRNQVLGPTGRQGDENGVEAVEAGCVERGEDQIAVRRGKVRIERCHFDPR